MERLEKIHQVLNLKRSNLERDVAASQAVIRKIEAQITAFKLEKQSMTQTVFDGQLSDNIARDMLALQKWIQNIDSQTDALRAQKTEAEAELAARKQALKEILVKQDVIKVQLDSSRKAAFEAVQDADSESRLEGWVTANRG